MRKRVYSVQLIGEHLDEIFNASVSLGHPVRTVGELGASIFLSMSNEVAAFDIERELVIKAEGESRQVDENDLRDVYALTVVLPYANAVIAEKATIGRARQAKLGERYETGLYTSLLDWKFPADSLGNTNNPI